MATFLDRLRDGPPIVADGGMGPLVSAASPRLRCPEEANLRAPDTVVSLHLSFINAGAELIETNTFGANRPKLAARYLEDELAAINEAAVKLARDARAGLGQRGVHRRLDRAARRAPRTRWPRSGRRSSPSRRSCSRAAASTCSWSRRSSTSTSS